MATRNHLYDIGQKKSVSFDVPVICVGNLAVGGTGKTPMVEYLVKLIAQDMLPGVLSRGYGRETTGFRAASDQEDARTIGDEPFQMYRKFKDVARVAVAEDRALGISLMLHEEHPPQAIILDDGLQHRAVRPSFSILLTDFRRPFYADYPLPFGRLRESRHSARRAQVVIVSKCPPDLSLEQQENMRTQIGRYTSARIFFTYIDYRPPVCFGQADAPPTRVAVVSGIASPKNFHAYARAHYQVTETIVFADHHAFSLRDIERIERAAERSQADILVTEKDFVKLCRADFQQKTNVNRWHYQPIRAAFLHGEQSFIDLLKKSLRA